MPRNLVLRKESTLFLLVFLAATVLRILSCRGDLWLDEVWTLDLVSRLSSWRDVFALQHDNNHPLNSLYLFLLGPGLAAWQYRLISLFSGVATLLCFWMFSRQLQFGERFIALILVSFSYLFILYSGEARGYSLAIACVAAIYLVCQTIEFGRAGLVQVFSAILLAFVGCAAHGSVLGFIVFLIPVILLRSFHKDYSLEQRRANLIISGSFFLVGCFYWLKFYRYLSAASGPRGPVFDVAIETLSMASGGPVPSAWNETSSLFALGFAGLTIFLLLIGFWRTYANSRIEFLTFLLLVFILPLIAVVIRGSEVLFPRYFLVSIFFANLLFAKALYFIFKGPSASNSVASKLVAFSLIAIILLGHSAHIFDLVRFARGNSFQFLSELTAKQSELQVSGNHPFRDQMMVNYFNRYVKAQGKSDLKYSLETSNQPSYCLIQNQDKFTPITEAIECLGRAAKLIQVNYSADQSGWNWAAYKVSQ